jgi:hypothetical protein
MSFCDARLSGLFLPWQTCGSGTSLSFRDLQNRFDDGNPDHPHEAIPRHLGCIIALGRVTNEDRRHPLVRRARRDARGVDVALRSF